MLFRSANDVLSGYLEDIQIEGATATFRFVLDHVDEIRHGGDEPTIVSGLHGRIAADVTIEDLDTEISDSSITVGPRPGREGL